MKQVNNEDFRRLVDDAWSDGSVIDAYAYADILRNDWKDVIHIPTSDTQQLIEVNAQLKKTKKWLMYNIKEEWTGKILMPVFGSSHFTLFVANIDKQEFYLLDPMNKNSTKVNDYALNFKNYLQECWTL